MTFRLFYKDIEVGTIEQIGYDFPRVCGRYKLSESIAREQELIFHYIEFSIQASTMFEENEEKWLEFWLAEKPKHISLIDSDDWKLIHENQEAFRIAVPNFLEKNEVIWVPDVREI